MVWKFYSKDSFLNTINNSILNGMLSIVAEIHIKALTLE